MLLTLREPVGVVGAITPWNFPLLQAMWKIAPALALGNTVVLKPASATPLTALLFAELLAEAGLPPGAFNVVPGPGAAVGKAMAEHPGIDKISFTGETETGKAILRAAAGTVKRVSMELGGKSPNIVFADADLEAAAKGAINAIFYGKGELCSAGSRLLVEESVHDALLEKLVERAKKMAAGRSARSEDAPGLARLREAARERGALRRRGPERGREARGRRPPGLGQRQGRLLRGHRLRRRLALHDDRARGDLRTRARHADVSDEAEAVAVGNATIYGLAAAVWSRDVKKAIRTAKALQGRNGLDQHVQPLRPGPSVRRLQAVGLRPGARTRRPRGVHAGQVDLGGPDVGARNPPPPGGGVEG